MFHPERNGGMTMAVQINWLNEPWAMTIHFSDKVTADDMREVIGKCLPRLRENPIYFLLDMTHVSSVDPRLFELSSLSEWIYHPNGRWFAYVQPHRMFSSIMKMRQRGNYKAFDDYNEGLAFVDRTSRAEQERVRVS